MNKNIILPKDSVLTLFFNFNNFDINFNYTCFQSETPVPVYYKIYYKTKEDIELTLLQTTSDIECIFMNIPEKNCERDKILNNLDKKYSNYKNKGYINSSDFSMIIHDENLLEKIEYNEAWKLYTNYINTHGLSFTGKLLKNN